MNAGKERTRFLTSIILSLSVSLFVYLYFFQVSFVISKRSVLFSLLIGILAGIIYWFLFTRGIKSQKTGLINLPVAIGSLIAAILILVLYDMPENFLFAPQTKIEISIPAEDDGGKPISLKWIHSGLADIGYKELEIKGEFQVTDHGLNVYPQEDESSILTWRGRAWDKLVLQFSEMLPGTYITFKVNEKTETYLSSDRLFQEEVNINLPVPGSWIFKILSFLSVLISLFFCIYLIACLTVRMMDGTPVKEILQKLSFVLLTGLLVAGFISINPNRYPLARDSGVFMYVADGLLSGEVPYKDIWDHKGPGIYFINALGLSAGMGRWGGWVVELISAFVSLILLFKLLQKTAGFWAAFIGAFIFLILFFVYLRGGNYVEEFSIPLSLLSLFLFLRTLDRNQSSQMSLFVQIGLLSGFNFLLRPNLISVFGSIGIFIVIFGLGRKDFQVSAHRMASMLMGFAVMLLITAIFFIRHSAFQDLIEAVFKYNFMYSEVDGARSLLNNLFNSFETQPFYLYLTMVGWVFLLLAILRKKKTLSQSILIWVILIGFIIEFVNFNLSGRGYNHYYLSLLPYICLISGLFLSEICKRYFENRIYQYDSLLTAISLSFLILAFPLEITSIFDSSHENSASLGKQQEIVSLVKSQIADEENLVFWGAETSLLYLLDKPSPTRFVYQYPLMNCKFLTMEILDEFIMDLEVHQPVIIDTSSTNPEIPALNLGKQNLNCPTAGLIFEYIEQNYHAVGEMNEGWIVYRSGQR